MSRPSVPEVIQFYLPRTPEERSRWSDPGRKAEATLLTWIHRMPDNFVLGADGYWYFYPDIGFHMKHRAGKKGSHPNGEKDGTPGC